MRHHREVFRVHKQALAADRSKVLTVKTQVWLPSHTLLCSCLQPDLICYC